MDIDVPYLASVKNLHKILDNIQHAAVPETFSYEFLRDLGFSSSNDRSVLRVLKYIGFLDSSGRPQDPYRDFVDHTKSKHTLAERLRVAYDDLYTSDKKAHDKSADELKGWFKSKTGKGDAVSIKIATTFKSLSQYADFSNANTTAKKPPAQEKTTEEEPELVPPMGTRESKFSLVHRVELHPCLSGCNPHPLYVVCAVIRQARVSEWKLMF